MDATAARRIPIDGTDYNAPYRPNLPEEDWLYVLVESSVLICQAVLDAYEARQVDDDLHYDLCGLEHNLELGEGAIHPILHTPASLEDLRQAIDRQVHCEPILLSAEEDALLHVLPLLVQACDQVLDLHDQADPEGNCCCDLCRPVWGLYYNLQAAMDLVGGPLGWRIELAGPQRAA
jgi:hypothetical protein